MKGKPDGARVERGVVHMRQLVPAGIIACLCIAIVALGTYEYGSTAATPAALSTGSSASTASASEVSTSTMPATFSDNGSEIIVHEFDSFDPSCASCAGMHAAIMAGIASLPKGVAYRFHAYPIVHPSEAASTTPAFDPRDILGYCIASTTAAEGDAAILAYASAAYADASATSDQLLQAIPAADRVAVAGCVTAMPENDMPITDVIARYQYDQVPVTPGLFIQIPGMNVPLSIGTDPQNVAAILQSLAADPVDFSASIQKQYAAVR